MDEQQRETFLEHFSSYGETTLVAFAVMGGIFGEGIDLRGSYCLVRSLLGLVFHKSAQKGILSGIITRKRAEMALSLPIPTQALTRFNRPQDGSSAQKMTGDSSF